MIWYKTEYLLVSKFNLRKTFHPIRISEIQLKLFIIFIAARDNIRDNSPVWSPINLTVLSIKTWDFIIVDTAIFSTRHCCKDVGSFLFSFKVLNLATTQDTLHLLKNRSTLWRKERRTKYVHWKVKPSLYRVVGQHSLSSTVCKQITTAGVGVRVERGGKKTWGEKAWVYSLIKSIMEALKHIGLYCKLRLYFLRRFCTDRENCTVKVGLCGANQNTDGVNTL